MKKSILLSVILIFLGSTIVSGYNPIPSYDVPICHKANFLEKQGSEKSKKPDTKGRRQMNIRTVAYPTVTTTIWIYSIDGKDVLGPFEQIGSGLITREIDDREWGVYVESDGHAVVDIWTTPIP